MRGLNPSLGCRVKLNSSSVNAGSLCRYDNVPRDNMDESTGFYAKTNTKEEKKTRTNDFGQTFAFMTH